MLTGILEGWPALSKWTFEFFEQELGTMPVKVRRLFGSHEVVRLSDYLASFPGRGSNSEPQGLPLYLDGWYFLQDAEQLARDYSPPEYFLPDWISRLFPRTAATWCRSIMIAPAGAFTKLHIDLNRLSGWQAQIVGRKRWILSPPEDLAPIFSNRTEREGGYPGVEHPRMKVDERVRSARYWTATVGPGDVIYVPRNWFHQVTVLEDAISLKYNFVRSLEGLQGLVELLRMTRAWRIMGGR